MKAHSAFAYFNLAIAISLGALGAHYLKEVLEPSSLASFEVGVRYHIYVSIILLISTRYISITGSRVLGVMGVGMLGFSLSIYLLSTRGVLLPADSARWLGPITPIGGVLIIASLIYIGYRHMVTPANGQSIE